MSTTIIHDFVPYVPPKPPATLPQPENTDIGKYLGVDSNVDLIYTSVENELPTPTSSDNGKFVGISSSKYTIVNAPTELPSVTSSDNGDVLTVVEGAWTKAEAPGGLPTPTGSDQFKSLKVNTANKWVIDTIKNIVSAGNLSDWTSTLSSFTLPSTNVSVLRETIITVEFRNMQTMSRTIHDFVFASKGDSTSRFQCICNETDGVYLRYFDIANSTTSQGNITVTSVKLT